MRLVTFLLLASVLTAQPWSDVLSSSRAIDWSTAGVSGGIPNRTNVYTTLGSGGFGTVSSFMHLTGATVGAQLTSAILNAGTAGSPLSSCTWTFSGTAANMLVGASQGSLGGSVTAGGTTYPANASTHSLAFKNDTAMTYMQCNFSGSTSFTISGYVTFGPPQNGWKYWDMIRVDTSGGGSNFNVLMQLRNPAPVTGYPYAVNVETGQPSGTIAHSSDITVVPGGRYYFSAQYNAGGTDYLNIYNPTTFALVGSASVAANSSGGTVTRLYLGNAENGVSAGTTSYFEDLMFESGATTTFPRLPTLADENTVQSVTSAQINAALAAAPANSVVALQPGIYTLSSGVTTGGRSNVTLRGAGADQTRLNITGSVPSCNSASVCVAATDANYGGGPSNGPVAWTAASYARGQTTITLASVPNLKVGNPIILDQDDSTSDDGGILVVASPSTMPYTPPGSPGPYSLDANANAPRPGGHNQEQFVTVTSCNGVSTVGASCSGTNVTVTISPGLYMPNWSAAKNPMAWWATNPWTGNGIEDLTVDSTAAGTSSIGIVFANGSNGWVRGVRSIDTARAHVQFRYATRITVRDSYFFLTQNWATSSYGVESYSSSDSLIENNIAQGIASPWMKNGPCTGCVFAYNFSVNNFYNGSLFNQNATGDHTAGNEYSLYEGNIGNVVNADVIHGTHNLMTYFRNYFTGPSPVCWQSSTDTSTSTTAYNTASYGTCNSNTSPINIFAFSRFYNVIGNVLGKPGFFGSAYDTGPWPIFRLGQGNGSVPSDANVASTMMRWGNWDSVNAAARWQASEVPSGLSGVQAPFANPLPSTQTLPNSFYRTARPSFWPTSKAWPGIGPDVSTGNVVQCSSGTYNGAEVTSSGQCTGGSAMTASASTGAHVVSNPAMDAYFAMGGNPYGTGPLLSFNANTLYDSIPPTCSIAPTSIGPYTEHQEISQQFTASDCNSSIFTISAGSLDGSGLSLSTGGLLSGSVEAGSFSFAVAYDTATAPFSLTILPAASSRMFSGSGGVKISGGARPQ